MWGVFLIAAAALKTPTINGNNAQDDNLTFCFLFFLQYLDGARYLPENHNHGLAVYYYNLPQAEGVLLHVFDNRSCVCG